MEAWRRVSGWPYDVSDLGRVRRLETGRVLKPQDSAGYPAFNLSSKGELWRAKAHWLVAAAFIGPAPEGAHLNHKDGNKWNNRPSNLEYVSQEENNQHAFRTGIMPLGEDRAHSKLTEEQVREIRRLGEQGVPQHVIGERFGIHQTHAGKIVNRVIWKHVA